MSRRPVRPLNPPAHPDSPLPVALPPVCSVLPCPTISRLVSLCRALSHPVRSARLGSAPSHLIPLGPAQTQDAPLYPPRLLVVVCEAKVLVLDLLSKEVTELPKACFENKSPTCVSFLFLGGQVMGGR